MAGWAGYACYRTELVVGGDLRRSVMNAPRGTMHFTLHTVSGTIIFDSIVCVAVRLFFFQRSKRAIGTTRL